MKAQFKYAFISGFYIRGSAFILIFILNALLITFSSLGKLPLAVHILSVTFGGIAVAVMLAANIFGDVAIARRLFSVPDSYLQMLTPVPRWKSLFAGIIAMAAMDLSTMAIAVTSQTWLAFNLVGNDIGKNLWENIRTNESYLRYGIWMLLLLIAGYFLTIMIIIFCTAIKKSLLYKIPASGLLTILLALACFYIASLLQLVVTPFGEVQRFGLFLIVSPESGAALPLLVLLALLEAAGLFLITSRLLEKKINL